MSRLEDAISIAPYIRSIAADVRGVGRGADDACMYGATLCMCVVYDAVYV